jgi:hypothetical protein
MSLACSNVSVSGLDVGDKSLLGEFISDEIATTAITPINQTTSI